MFRQIRKKIGFARFLYLHRRNLSTIEGWQAARLRELTQHAKRNIPLYGELFSSVAFDPDTIKSLADVSRIPVTEKGVFLERLAEEYTDNSRSTHAVWKKTSGTAGKPLSVLVSDALLNPYYADFVCFRFLLGSFISFRPFRKARIAHINIRAPRRKNQLFITISDLLSDPDKAIRRIAKYKPNVVASYASILLELAKKVSENPDLLPEKPRYVASFGEMLTPSMRRFIESALECEVYDRYGGGEIGAVALECHRHDGMHVHCESAIVEIVDGDGNALPSGEYGRVIITDLLNYNMPFIRYEIGDRGMLVRDKCACGLETPRLWLEGRYSAFLTFGGRNIHHLEFDGALDGLMNVITQYQIAKLAQDHLKVRVVPGPLFDASSISIIEEKILQIVGPRMRVSVESVPSVPRTPRGKSLIISDESPDPEDEER